MSLPSPKIYVTRRLTPAGLAPIAAEPGLRVWDSEDAVPRDTLLHEICDTAALLSTVSEKVDAALLDHAPRLELVANMAAGYDNVDVPALTRRGILLTNTPDVLTETTADLTFALLLGIARRIGEGERLVRAGRWPIWSPFRFLGADVHHATLGIVGLGRIGAEVAKRARGFNMRVLYHNRGRNPDAETRLGCTWVPLDTLLGSADFVVVLTPLTSETRHFISAAQLAAMKPTAYLINAARGPVVDSNALYRALRDRRIAGAALDVTDPEPLPTDHPLLRLDNCLIVPHVGSASVATRTRMARLAAENVAAFLRGERVPTPVNPEVLPPVGADG